jgi:guanosine-3',5'-bis(diphosphate) 3'-pyrophosphohydrolase
MTDLTKIARAYTFAAEKHTHQVRKGEAREPYINHPCDVAYNVARIRPDDVNLICAAVLHDTIEDTDTEYEDILQLFGEDVANLVAEVTDNKALPKAERKQAQVDSAPHKSDRAKILKLCDKASNLGAMAMSPPANWDENRRKEYLGWGLKVAAGLKGVDSLADKHFDAAVELCAERLGISAAS